MNLNYRVALLALVLAIISWGNIAYVNTVSSVTYDVRLNVTGETRAYERDGVLYFYAEPGASITASLPIHNNISSTVSVNVESEGEVFKYGWVSVTSDKSFKLEPEEQAKVSVLLKAPQSKGSYKGQLKIESRRL